MLTELETDRLRLRQWKEEDFAAYAEYYAHEETAKLVGGRCHREAAWRRLASLIGHWTLRGYGYWAVLTHREIPSRDSLVPRVPRKTAFYNKLTGSRSITTLTPPRPTSRSAAYLTTRPIA
jgi:RimJ/RimL family protein N-acetyltransferase